MKKVFYVCAALAVALPCFAAGPSWDGTWKMDAAKSKLTGETFTIEQKGNMLHYSNGVVSYDYACDGKAYSTIADRTITCTGSAQAGYDYVAKAGNTVLSKSRHGVSADGKTMTVHGTTNHPDGTTTDFADVYRRESGTSGLPGKWVNTKTQVPNEIMVIATKGDWIKIDVPAYKETIEGKMDGSNLAIKGPNVPAGVWHTVKPEGANKLRYTTKYNDKVLDEGVQTLSADGKTIVDEEWVPGKMNEKSTVVYERQ